MSKRTKHTTMTPLQQLETKIRQALPRLQEFGIGCEADHFIGGRCKIIDIEYTNKLCRVKWEDEKSPFM